MADPVDESALATGAAIGSISARAQLAVAGPDRATYLQGLLTNDIQALTEGSGCYAAWLTPQGRMLTDMHVLQSAGMILLDVPAQEAELILARLDQFLFSEDVRLESLAEAMTGVWLHGPRAAQVIERVVRGVVGLAEWGGYQHATGTFDGNPVSVARIDQLGVPGYCVFLARAAVQQFTAAALSAGARVISPDALHAVRIAAGYPVFGVDMTADTIPLEAGIEERAISFTKGCFVGQEVVIRVLHRGAGRVAKKLVGFRLEPAPAQNAEHALGIAGHPSDSIGHPSESVGHALGIERHPLESAGHPLGIERHPLESVGHPFRGAKVSAGEREIGFITSAAMSPTRGSIALGYVHRDFTTAGTVVQVEGHPATVVGLPMA